ncbi:MAG: type I glutamate--ammonia ligase [Candidatus Doudnabacteria bacterium]|nr:type I glutamate--ammonia ligase [Candidatus Doudnabacteria bacterium]
MNHVAFDQSANEGYYHVDSDEAVWNTGQNSGEKNLGYKLRHKEGYFPVAPHDTLMDIRSEMVAKMLDVGIDVETHHHEVATAGQNEIDMKYNTLVSMGDQSLMYKYIVKNVARAHNLVATFMPKPLFGDNGSGMHTHQSIWRSGQNTFFEENGYAQLSQTAKYYIGGILKHAESLMAFCAPTTNSYKRLVPGFEAPVNLTYSQRNRSAAVRIPMYSKSPKSKRIEFRSPDATANPYLAFSAMLMAGLDGVQNRIEPGEPFDENTYESQRARGLHTVPRSLEQSLVALENDHMYLLKGDVFTPDVIDTWLSYKREKEIDPMRLRPHPYEFHLYFDA